MIITPRFISAFCSLFILLFLINATAYAALENGIPFRTSLDPQSIANVEIIVPKGATKLTVAITEGSGDLDLYLKYGSPVTGGKVSEIDADADILSDGPTADELIVITLTTKPALRAGAWYIATLNYNNETTTFTITASIEESQYLPLPTSQTFYPIYSPIVTAVSGNDPSKAKPIGVGNVANGGDTLAINIGLASPSDLYDAYFALHAPALAPDELFMLGQDGNFYPASEHGLVKWKHSASDSIDEQLFGEIPISLFPGGTYNLYFLLTAANSLDNYYLWGSHFDAPDNVVDGSAGYFNGTLQVPDATIIYQGGSYDSSSPMADDGMAAIIKDGKTYLYHPALGNAELSDYNTRKAVGYFMTGMSASEIATLRTKRSRPSNSSTLQASSRSASTTIPMAIGVGQSVLLGTDVGIELRDHDGHVTATNSRRRFAVVKTGSTDKDLYFLVPASNAVPTEIVDQVNGAIQLYNSNYISSLNTVRSDIQATDKIETFASFFRQIPIIVTRGGWSDNQLEAFEKDSELTTLINTIDLFYTTLEFSRQIYGLIPLECLDSVTSPIFRANQSLMLKYMTRDMNAVSQLDDVNIKGTFSSVSVCISQIILTGSGALIPAAAVLEVYSSFFDVVSVGEWVIEDVGLENVYAVFYGSNDAYDLATIGINDMMAYLSIPLSTRTPQMMVQNMDDGSKWIVPSNLDADSHHIKNITPGGVVLSYSDEDSGLNKIITTMNWGRGKQTDISSSISELCKYWNFDADKLDISDSGRLYFYVEQCLEGEPSRWGGKTTVTHKGIYTVMADGSDGHFVPVVINQTEYQTLGYDNIDVDALKVSGNGNTIVFSSYDSGARKYKLYSVDSSGEILREIATSSASIDITRISNNADRVIFDYTLPDNKTSIYSISMKDGKQIKLVTEPGLELSNDTIALSHDGMWVAGIAYDYNQEDNLKMGIALMRSDGSSHHFVNTFKDWLSPATTTQLQFTLNSKNVVFTGSDLAVPENERLLDIYAVSIDPKDPYLRPLIDSSTDTELQHKSSPVLR